MFTQNLAEVFTLGHQLHVSDAQGRELGMVKQRLMVMLPTFDIEVGGTVRGCIRKRFAFFKPTYEVDFNGWRCEGDFLAWDYDVYAGSSVVVHISKKLLQWGDTYVVDIVRPEDELTALMLCIAIDAANCSD